MIWGIDFCRPIKLVPKASCVNWFPPIPWKEETVPPEVVSKKHYEFCVNATQDESYKIGFMGPRLGKCEGVECDCRENPVCPSFGISHDYSQGQTKAYLMQGYSNTRLQGDFTVMIFNSKDCNLQQCFDFQKRMLFWKFEK